MSKPGFIASIAISIALASTLGASGLSTPKTSSNQIIIPAAISAEGANGTYFRSDIRITNLRDTAQLVVLYWAPSGAAGPADFELVELESGETFASDDFVAEVLHESGIGAVGVQALDDASEVDPDALLHVTSRVWTLQPGTEGTSSQAFAPIAAEDVFAEHVFIIGHTRNEQYRTNIGIVNLDEVARTFDVTVSGETPTLLPEVYQVTVPAFSMTQFPTEGAPQNRLRVDIEQQADAGGTRSPFWIAYASSVDNVTGDGWTTVGAELPAK